MRNRRNTACAGETIAETLVAVLIVALTFTFLCTAIVVAARIDNQAKSSAYEFVTENEDTTPVTVSIAVVDSGDLTGAGLPSSIPATQHTTRNGYVYYVYRE